MERHIRRNHPLDIKQSIFHSQNILSKTPILKTQNHSLYNFTDSFDFRPIYLPNYNSNNNNSLPNAQASTAPIGWSGKLDMILDTLRKTVEFKRLTEELSFTSMRGYSAGQSHNQLFPQSTLPRSCPLPNLEDLEIIGYIGYICCICLTAHPLAIYRHKYLPGGKAVQTVHVCNTERMTKLKQEQQRRRQEIDRGTTVSNLYTDELPKSMLQAAKEWTDGCALLMTCKISVFPDEVLQDFMLFNNKQRWAARAVKDGFTILTDKELSDFIYTVRKSTFVVGKLEQEEKNKGSGTVYFMGLSNKWPSTSTSYVNN
jgi:hypothetical protein